MANKKAKRTVVEATEEEVMSYNTRIKQNLIRWKDDFEDANNGAKLNYSEIARRMERDFQITTSPQKISSMFDTRSDREVKLQEVAALCQLFGIPMQDICEHPTAPISHMETSKLLRRKNAKKTAIKNLYNPFYAGTYYCYYFSPKHYQNQIKPVEESQLNEAVLEISIENAHTMVTLKEMKTNKTFFGDKVLPSFTLTGNLYHFENPDMAYCFLADQSGRRAMALMFTFLNLSSDIRYYLTAGMMAFSINQIHVPLFQKMALFRVRQDIHNDPAAADVIRGILTLNTCPIILDKETLDQLVAEDEDMRKLVSEEKAMKTCYVFSEATVSGNAFFIRDEDEKMRKILKLRKSSLNPAHEIVSDPDYFADFIKRYQQRQLPVRPDSESEESPY